MRKKRVLTSEQRAYAAQKTREWRKRNPEKAYKLDTEKQFRKKYGITLTQYDEMFDKQKGKCALCNKPETIINGKGRRISRLAVDHCHTTKKVRGLLCFRCNTAIGQIQKENLENKIALYFSGELK